MKKLLLSLGAIVAIIAPISAVISCSSKEDGNGSKPSRDNKVVQKPAKIDSEPWTELSRSVPLNGGDSTPETGADLKEMENLYADSVLFSQASKAAEKEETDHDFVRVGGEGLTLRNKGVVTLQKYKRHGDSVNTFAELKPGDYLEFVFDNENDIKDFTKRVLYDDGQTEFNINANGMDGAEIKDLRFVPYIVEGNEVIAKEEITSASDKGAKESIFKLSTPKRNVVRMTFNDIFNGSKKYVDAQKLYLREFEDQNDDGVEDINDVQMTPMFLLEKDKLPDKYGERSDKWQKLIAGYHSDVITNKIEELEKARLAKIAEEKRLEALKFDDAKVQWKPNVDLTTLKIGDIIQFKGNGMLQTIRVTEQSNGEFKATYSNGADAKTYAPFTIKDGTHIEHTTPGRRMPPSFPSEPDKVDDYEILKIGNKG